MSILSRAGADLVRNALRGFEYRVEVVLFNELCLTEAEDVGVHAADSELRSKSACTLLSLGNRPHASHGRKPPILAEGQGIETKDGVDPLSVGLVPLGFCREPCRVQGQLDETGDSIAAPVPTLGALERFAEPAPLVRMPLDGI